MRLGDLKPGELFTLEGGLAKVSVHQSVHILWVDTGVSQHWNPETEVAPVDSDTPAA